jgi:hypothetical protein
MMVLALLPYEPLLFKLSGRLSTFMRQASRGSHLPDFVTSQRIRRAASTWEIIATIFCGHELFTVRLANVTTWALMWLLDCYCFYSIFS